MISTAAVAEALADAFLAGDFVVDELAQRGAKRLGKRWRWLRPLARRVCARFNNQTRPRRIAVTRFLLGDHGFRNAAKEHSLKIVDHLSFHAAMLPAEAASDWAVPAIRTTGELANWLEVSIAELDWFADLRRLEFKQNQDRLRNYLYRTMVGRFGKIRLIEAPKPRLKSIQRRILTEILDRVPLHTAVHGFRRGRSIKTFASEHLGKRVVLRIDLEDFFPSISLARIQSIFRTLGYPERVADRLAGLCTNAAPTDIWDESTSRIDPFQMRTATALYARSHLPQGAPTSPALANLCAYRLDCRLSALARSAGANYTRYADDLAFSGDRPFDRCVKRFQLHVAATVIEEGFSVHHRKTRIMRRSVRQRLAGIIVNEHPNIARKDFDRLKATLTNCVRHGAQSQNLAGCDDFHSHLLGRVAFVEMINPARGQKLRHLFNQIQWSPKPP